MEQDIADNNREWRANNDKWRAKSSRRPDVYYSGPGRDDSGKPYVIIGDGWRAPSTRHFFTKTVPSNQMTDKEIYAFGKEEAAKLAAIRGLTEPASAKIGKIRKRKGSPCALREALNQIEADVSAGANKGSAGNVKAGCRQFHERLPAERLDVDVFRITPTELERHMRIPIAEDPKLSFETKKQYLSLARDVTRILIDVYDLDEDCEQALRAPSGMEGKDADERPLFPSEIKRMEEEIDGTRIVEILGDWADVIKGAYYHLTALSPQPADVLLTKWRLFEPNLEFLSGNRQKTKNRFEAALSRRYTSWLTERRAKGGIYASNYVFVELVFGIRACEDGKIKELTQQQEEKMLTGATERFRLYFGKFLRDVCGIVRDGVTLKSFRHTNLPYLRSIGAPTEVGMDMAGHLTLEAFLGYTRHSTSSEQRWAAERLERHYRNLRYGIEEPMILTPQEAAAHTSKCCKELEENLGEKMEDIGEQVCARVDDNQKAILAALAVLKRDIIAAVRDRAPSQKGFPLNASEVSALMGFDQDSNELLFVGEDAALKELRTRLAQKVAALNRSYSLPDRLIGFLCTAPREMFQTYMLAFWRYCCRARQECEKGSLDPFNLGPAPNSHREIQQLLLSQRLDLSDAAGVQPHETNHEPTKL